MQNNCKSLPKYPLEETQRRDLAELCGRKLPLEELAGKRFFISGATGLLGSSFVFALIWLNALCKTEFKICAMARSKEKAERIFGKENESLSFYIGDINSEVITEEKFDYIIHCASVTSSKAFVETPVDTIKTALCGTENMIKLALQSSARLLYLSSLESYGTTDPAKESISESEGGYIDQLSPRSSYSEGKRMAECLCASYAAQYGLDFVCARLTQCFGAGVEYNDSRVFAQFCRSIIEKKDIELHTSGSTVRNYCYTTDAVSALLYIIARGGSSQAYNVANMENAVSIKEMAQLAADIGKVNVVFNTAAAAGRGYNPEMVIKLNTAKLRSLGWEAFVPMREMLERTAAAMAAQNTGQS